MRPPVTVALLSLLLLLPALAPGAAAVYLALHDADLICDESPNLQFPKECDNGLPFIPDCLEPDLGGGWKVDPSGPGPASEAWDPEPGLDLWGTSACLGLPGGPPRLGSPGVEGHVPHPSGALD